MCNVCVMCNVSMSIYIYIYIYIYRERERERERVCACVCTFIIFLVCTLYMARVKMKQYIRTRQLYSVTLCWLFVMHRFNLFLVMCGAHTIKLLNYLFNYIYCWRIIHYKKQNEAMHKKKLRLYWLFLMLHFILPLIMCGMHTIKIFTYVILNFI